MKGTAYLFQAVLVVAWWAGLCVSDRFFAAFQFSGIPAVAFWSFLLPDLLLVAGLSLVCAYTDAKAAPWILLGAFGYAALYCCNATLLTGSGYLGKSHTRTWSDRPRELRGVFLLEHECRITTLLRRRCPSWA